MSYKVAEYVVGCSFDGLPDGEKWRIYLNPFCNGSPTSRTNEHAHTHTHTHTNTRTHIHDPTIAIGENAMHCISTKTQSTTIDKGLSNIVVALLRQPNTEAIDQCAISFLKSYQQKARRHAPSLPPHPTFHSHPTISRTDNRISTITARQTDRPSKHGNYVVVRPNRQSSWPLHGPRPTVVTTSADLTTDRPSTDCRACQQVKTIILHIALNQMPSFTKLF